MGTQNSVKGHIEFSSTSQCRKVGTLTTFVGKGSSSSRVWNQIDRGRSTGVGVFMLEISTLITFNLPAFLRSSIVLVFPRDSLEGASARIVRHFDIVEAI